MAETTTAALFASCDLPQAWAGQNAWRILETRFGEGLRFLSTWRAWKNDPQRPRLLHYVSLTQAPPPLDELLACAAPYPELLALAHELAPQWFGLLPGFHRLTLGGGRVLLTLCVGELTTLLRQQQFIADSVYLDPAHPDSTEFAAWDIWTVKALARCCRRGTGLATTVDISDDLRADLTQCGFEMGARQTEPATGPRRDPLTGQFNPRWTIKTTRDAAPGRAVEVGSCAVIGAGLAGASVAAALARRGWQVQVLDQGEAPAAGASGLPVGLVVPHVSVDDCPLSRLSRSGVRLMLQQARSLLQQGQDWDPTGTLEHRVDGTPGLPLTWPMPGRDWSQVSTPDTASRQMTAGGSAPAWTHGMAAGDPAIWHAQAAWLKPAQLVRAWLSQAGITFQGKAPVATLRQNGNEWELLDAQGEVLARANRVVFANAGGALPLLEAVQTAQPALDIHVNQLPVMHGVRGQLSWAMHARAIHSAFPPFPVNGAGSVVPVVPVDGGSAWFIGSSYQPDTKPASPDEKNHAANLGRLHKLIPTLGQALAEQFAAGPINAWKNTRCTTADRLPVVGPLHEADNPSLWICAGMGSRGMSFSVLCAELLAARWGAEPLPIEAGLAQSLNALRGSAATACDI
ncbi:FAD-dependent 5-carboxymethylaminomethyl-2-thiouridine(34) oxidoreductase MnmC [Rhodoferax ferrireducens]|uniref:FAD-dependent 5-carboxymethylaminomethyl-2-thiouridine(34) oxidoreductase MnmC n=1 Tax=Rhodoferax ferrireducens TaxID=192843 RepID=UPI000E0DA99F|nr:FAD-dependent 5-carboxymethylaminomethyl-2-thiouridine(34) oxidoreductase MnmC [Rhodoferax ferrireducens]